MTAVAQTVGASVVGRLTDIAPWEAELILSMRFWMDGPEGQAAVWNGFARTLGFGIVAAGKGKNNPLRIDAVPAAYEKEAAERNMNARMLVEFVDGSKTASPETCPWAVGASMSRRLESSPVRGPNEALLAPRPPE